MRSRLGTDRWSCFKTSIRTTKSLFFVRICPGRANPWTIRHENENQKQMDKLKKILIDLDVVIRNTLMTWSVSISCWMSSIVFKSFHLLSTSSEAGSCHLQATVLRELRHDYSMFNGIRRYDDMITLRISASQSEKLKSVSSTYQWSVRHTNYFEFWRN